MPAGRRFLRQQAAHTAACRSAVTLKPGNRIEVLPAAVGRLLVRVTVTGRAFRDDQRRAREPAWCRSRQLWIGDAVGAKPLRRAGAAISPGVDRLPVRLGEVGRLRGQVETSVPVMPGSRSMRRRREQHRRCRHQRQRAVLFIEIAFFMFVALIAALLIDVDFGHQSAEVLGVVRQVVKVGGVEDRTPGPASCSWSVSRAQSRITSSDSPPPSVIELVL